MQRLSKFFPLIFILLMTANPRTALAQGQDMEKGEVDQFFLEIEQNIEIGRFSSAQSMSEQIVYTSLNIPGKIRFLKIQIQLSYAFERRDEMHRWIEKMLIMDEQTILDPAKFPPEAVSYLENRKQERRLEKEALKPISPAVKSGKKWSFLNLMPFGVGHFRNGELFYGFSFLLLDTAIGIHALARLDTEFGYSEKDSDAGDYNIEFRPNELAGSLIGLASFSGIWGAEMLHFFAEEQSVSSHSLVSYRKILSYAPFGVGQIQNDSPLLGTVFCVAELATGLEAYYAADQSDRRRAASLFLALVFGGALQGRLAFKESSTGSLPRAQTNVSHYSFAFYPQPMRSAIDHKTRMGFGFQLNY